MLRSLLSTATNVARTGTYARFLPTNFPASFLLLSRTYKSNQKPVLPDMPIEKAELEFKEEVEIIQQRMDDKERKKQELIGVVVSTKCSKSITVRIENRHFNRKYQVMVRSHRKKMAHDPEEKARVGDIVRIIQSRPYSRKKRHLLSDVIQRPKSADVDLTAEYEKLIL